LQFAARLGVKHIGVGSREVAGINTTASPLLLVFVLFFLASTHKTCPRLSVHTLRSIININADQQLFEVDDQSIYISTNNNTTQHTTTTANMRSSIFFIAPFMAAAYAQSSDVNTTSTTAPYTNGFTSYLTQTNSLGVVTGMPSVATDQSALPPAVTTQPTAVTSQPEVATIPAGLPVGVTNIVQNISRSLTSFEVSVGSSTTVVIGAASDATIVTGTGTETGAAATASSSSGSSSSNDDDDSSASGSSSSSEESGSSTSGSSAAESTGSADSSAGRVTLASAGVLGFGALVAAFL